MNLGIDIGSVAIGVTVMENNTVRYSDSLAHNGNIAQTLEKQLAPWLENGCWAGGIMTTGRGKDLLPSVPHVDWAVAVIEGVRFLAGEQPVHHILAIGGESFCWIALDESGSYKRHEINTNCASGTGAFLDQQALRLGLSTAQLAQMAAEHQGEYPKIATRCAVFAKSDLIHYQQEGKSLASICCGLCEGIARSITDTLIRGRKLEGNIAIVGGVALNSKVVEALQEILGQPLLVFPYAHTAGAVGAALKAQSNHRTWHTPELVPVTRREKGRLRPPLELSSASSYPDFASLPITWFEDVEITWYQEPPAEPELTVLLGIDIGSTSTKATVALADGSLLVGLYTKTEGRPIEVTQKLLRALKHIAQEHDWVFHWQAVGTTGSGRKMIGRFLGADLEVNEITAHARAAVQLDPEVDTIIEIGGQDAKWTRIKGGHVVQSVMNYICAAGTGSFIEEQAQKLKVPLQDYARLAMGEDAPYTSDRCTVYMERDLNHLLAQGWRREALLAAVVHSVRDNYLQNLVGYGNIGERIFFQGATARNKALVAAFEQALGKPIIVPPYCHLTGAYGVCLILRDRGITSSSFRGLELAESQVARRTEVCTRCRNNCQITILRIGEQEVAWGFLCGREQNESKPARGPKWPNPVTLYEQVLRKHMDTPTPTQYKGTVGIPRALPLVEYLPLWEYFFRALGYQVVTTRDARELIQQGKNLTASDFCAPIAAIHGHVRKLLEQDVDYLFLPSLIMEKHASLPQENHEREAYFCYYTTYISVVLRNRACFAANKERFLAPNIDLSRASEEIAQELFKTLGEKFATSAREIEEVFLEAQRRFDQGKQALQEAGREIMEKARAAGKQVLVLVGRPYNILDRGMNQKIPGKILAMGLPCLYMDMVPVDVEQLSHSIPFIAETHWHYGKRILEVTEMIARSEHLFPVYMTNFRCSPDAFVQSYFKHIMESYRKPYLVLQLDELGSDVGYTTRIEAAVDAFQNWQPRPRDPAISLPYISMCAGKTIIVPHCDPITSHLAAACFRRQGHDALVALESDTSIREGLRYTGGGECLPLGALLGSVIKTVKELNLDPRKTVLYSPITTIPCNFPQFSLGLSLGLKKAGMAEIELYVSQLDSSDEPYALSFNLFRSYIMGGLLRQMCYKIRPYEVQPGATAKVQQEALQILGNAIESGKSLEGAFKRIVANFKAIPTNRPAQPRPLVAIIGDMYVKWNPVFNQGLESFIERMGCEVITPSPSDILHSTIIRACACAWEEKAFRYISHELSRGLVGYLEKRFRMLCVPVLGRVYPFGDYNDLRRVQRWGVSLRHEGETIYNLLEFVSLLSHHRPDAVVHINPLFCCPGAVTSALFDEIQEEFGIPIVNLFYDGTADPNSILIPHLHYLNPNHLATGEQPFQASSS